MALLAVGVTQYMSLVKMVSLVLLLLGNYSDHHLYQLSRPYCNRQLSEQASSLTLMHQHRALTNLQQAGTFLLSR
jgi:hypothetical protein